MLEKTENIKLQRKVQIYGLIVFALLAYHMLRYVNEELWSSLYLVYYTLFVPVFVAFYFYFRRLKDGIEVKILVLFWVWVLISRWLNGDFFMTIDGDMVLNMGFMCAIVPTCIVLKGRARERLLDGISIVMSAFYTLLGLVCLYGVLYQKELYNPFTGNSLMSFFDGYRLSVFAKNPNEGCLWFFLTLCLLVYQFIKRRSIVWRVPIVLAAIVNYLVLAVTYSRNAMVAFSLCLALLAISLVLRYKSFEKLWAKLALCVVILCVVLPVGYKSFDLATGLIDKLSNSMVMTTVQETVDSSDTQASAEEADTISYNHNRGLEDTGRLSIYKSAIDTFQQEPLRLLRGCFCKDVMSIANTVITYPNSHFHNTFLEVLVLTGIPGFLLVMAFCLLLAIKILRLFFSDAPLAVKSLVLPVVGSLSYNMLETTLFVVTDIRSVSFFILAGAVIAYADEWKKA